MSKRKVVYTFLVQAMGYVDYIDVLFPRWHHLYVTSKPAYMLVIIFTQLRATGETPADPDGTPYDKKNHTAPKRNA